MPSKSTRPDLHSDAQYEFATMVEAREGEKSADAPMVDTEDGPLPAWSVFIASTAGENRNGDIIDQNTWKLGPYHKNPLILWMHDRSAAPLGTGKAWVENKGSDDARLMVKVTWDLEDAEARKIAGKVHRKVIRAGSMCCSPGKGSMWRDQLPESDPNHKADSWGRAIQNQELREFSLVTIPGDANCLRQSEQPNPFTPPTPSASTTSNNGQSMDFKLLLCTVLALSAESTDEEIQAAADALPDHKTRADQAEAAIASALGADELPADYAVQLTAATDRAGFVPLAEAQQMVIDATAAAATDPKITALAEVKAAVKDGRITPALVPHWEALAASSPAACTASLGGLTASSAVPLTSQVDPNKPPPKAVVLSAHDRQIMKQLDITEAEYLSSKNGA